MPQTRNSDLTQPAAPSATPSAAFVGQPAPPVTALPGGLTMVRPGVYTPTAIWKGFVAQRKELFHQLESIQDERRSLSDQLHRPNLSPADRTGMEGRIADLDARIKAVDQQRAAADAQVAAAAAVPGAVVEEPPPIEHDNGPPTDAIIFVTFMLLCVFPLTIAFSRRLWRRGAAVVTAMPGDLMERMSRLDQAVESIAVEVERIGEGQRFMTRIFTENGERAIGAGAAESVRQPLRDAVPVEARNPGAGR